MHKDIVIHLPEHEVKAKKIVGSYLEETLSSNHRRI